MNHLVEEELARSREIIASGAVLVPRFRVFEPDIETTIFVQLPDDPDGRAGRMSLISNYMAVKLVRSFVFSAEIVDPDASTAVLVTRAG